MKKGRIYVCHTFYHLYVAFLKEFALPDSEHGNATVVLSKMSNDFGDIQQRIEKSGVFKQVVFFDEKRETFFSELTKYKINRGNVLFNMIPRIIFTSKFAKLQEKYVPVDFRDYDEVNVFCDRDPIGLYLNKKRIKYHAVEDGLNCLANIVPPAKRDNPKAFKLKKFMSMGLNLIFLPEGYSKYCIDVEVNDVSLINDSFYKYKEVPRKKLEERLSDEQKNVLVSVFVKDKDLLVNQIKQTGNCDGILILTEPLCTLDVRERLFRDLINQYKEEGMVFLKIHPRDELDYEKLFPDVFRFDKKVPMEILNFFTELHFKKVVSVFTKLDSIKFADEKVYLGAEFMDKYEDRSMHEHAF